MNAFRLCGCCKTSGPGTIVPVLGPEHQLLERHLCHRCWNLLLTGWLVLYPEDPIEGFLYPQGLRLTRAQMDDCILEGTRVFEREFQANQLPQQS